MALEGRDKQVNNFLAERLRQQDEFWPTFTKEWDEKAEGKRFKSEVLSLSDLWRLYRRGVTDALTEEDISRGRKPEKKDKGYEVVPIKAFELPGQDTYFEKTKLHHGEYGYLHFPHWLYARDRARKDLYWLGKHLLHHDFEAHVHQVICNQFVQKDFDGVFKEGYTLKDLQKSLHKQSRVPRIWLSKSYEYNTDNKEARYKDFEGLLREEFGKYIPDPTEVGVLTNWARTMILLDPRGFFKSTIDVVDVVQWLINAPDIRILIVGGVIKLTAQFLTGVKSHFYLPKGVKPGPFHYLFPEYVLRGVDGTSEEDLRLPDGVRQHGSLDPSVGITSVGSNKAGFHCDVLKMDDIVTETNCLTEDTRESILQKADSTTNLLMPWGWHDIIGTRYFTDDYYGRTKDKHDESPEDFNLKFFQRACWIVKPEFRHIEAKSLFELTEDMVDLVFPEHANFKYLRAKLRKNEKEFRCQQLNQPVWGNENPTFPHELLVSRFKSFQEATGKPGEIIGAIDLAKEDKKFSDFTCLAVGKVVEETIPNQQQTADSLFSPWEQGKRWILVVLDVEFGKWSQSEIAYRIAKMNDKWRPKRWKAEDTGGLESFKEKIINTSKENFGHWPLIHWQVPNNQYNAKVNRIKGMEILLRDARMYFMVSSWNSDVFIQLERYVGQKSTRTTKDDVPDCLSMLASALPNIFPLTPKEKEALAAQKEQEYRQFLMKAMKRTIFGDDSGGFGMQQQYFPTPGRELPEEPQSSDPLSDYKRRLFGGNGMR